MRLRPARGRSAVQDRRGGGGGGFGGLGGGEGRGYGFPMPRGRRGIGGGLGVIITLIAALFLGPQVLGGGGGGFAVDPGYNDFQGMPQAAGGAAEDVGGPDDPEGEFVERLVENVQLAWEAEFAEAGQTYQPTELVLFEQQTQSGCGPASSATGPFYCPLDSLVYIDLEFFQQLQTRFGAPGDFAQAYVIAHEFGHHVQNVLGVSDQVRDLQQRNPDDANELSVLLELQADCFAGVWGHSAYQQNVLEPGDIEEGLAAAAAVGDDRIQASATGRVDPETWTHGSSEQRQEWFTRGFESGEVGACDTFGAA